jgi:hypothetical protein
MKGVMSIIEVMITGIILLIAFLHFFPQYTIKSKWNPALLNVKVRDTIKTIDRLNKTYQFATDLNKFDNFMNSVFLPEETGEVTVWWRNVYGISAPQDTTPYFTEGYKESMIDVYNTTTDGYHVYSFTLGLGYPF